MTHDWLLPISAVNPRLHLVPVGKGPLVKAACKKLVNLQFATRPTRAVKRCHYCAGKS